MVNQPRPVPSAVQTVSFTVFENDGDRLSKAYELMSDGRVAIDGCTQMARGKYRVVTFDTDDPRRMLADVGVVLDKLSQRQALALGVPSDGSSSGRIVVKKAIENGATGAIARTLKHMKWPDELGLLFCDGDETEELHKRLTAYWPGFTDVVMLVRPGASASVALNGKALKKSEHGFVLIDEPERSKDGLDALMRLSWLHGDGWIKLSRRGDMLVRGLLDASVGSRERLVYEGAVVIGAGLERLPRTSTVIGGDGVLCASALLAFAEKHAPMAPFDTQVAEAKADPALIAKSRELFRIYREDKIVEMMEVAGITREQAEEEFDRAEQGDYEKNGKQYRALAPSHVLHWPDGGRFTVADIQRDPLKYHKRACADPVEGLAYSSRTCGYIYAESPQILIISHAHGGAFRYVAPLPWHDWSTSLGPLLREVIAANENNPSRFFSDAKEIERLARLAPAEYQQQRVDAAAAQRLRLAQLDQFVDATRKALARARNDTSSSIKAEPFVLRDPRTIPERKWLYGRHLIRQFVSATIGHGAVGKSSLLIVEALALATGRPLVGIQPPQRARVWYWNGEDPKIELERRIGAACRHFEISAAEIAGWLFVNSGRDENSRIVIAQETREGTVINAPLATALIETITKNQIDVMLIDPFVSSHKVSENNNNAIDEAVKEWGRIADITNIAIGLAHHPRKTGGAEVTVEDSRGAVALLNAARAARVVNTMDEKQAGKAGVRAEERSRYFNLADGKVNLAPRFDKVDWYHLRSVVLGNGPNGGPGDSVGVVTAWQRPDLLDGADFAKVAAVIQTGNWRLHPQSNDYVGKAIAQALGLDLDEMVDRFRVSELLKVWLAVGWLVVVKRMDVQRKGKDFVALGTGYAVAQQMEAP
jgi:RecA-family ATPase